MPKFAYKMQWLRCNANGW